MMNMMGGGDSVLYKSNHIRCRVSLLSSLESTTNQLPHFINDPTYLQNRSYPFCSAEVRKRHQLSSYISQLNA
jgi:hypothetical protein